MNDTSTKVILLALNKHDTPVWSKEDLASINSDYHPYLLIQHVGLLHGKLMYYKTIFRDCRHIALIIVPTSLRRSIFSHHHAGPSGGHMGEYKTMYRLRMRFYWLHMRSDIKTWVKSCAHCCAYDVWCSKKSELYFSWPVPMFHPAGRLPWQPCHSKSVR